MSKDRDSGDSASGGGGLRFRNQSPSSNRRSRDRERTADKRAPGKDRDIDASTMLISNEVAIDHSEFLDDSQLSGKYKSFRLI